MSPGPPVHLRPTSPLADRVLLPGDPGRALALAQALLSEPKMFNHHRGLWGYTGTASDGSPLTIQATGMGGPSAAIVLTELIGLGVRRAIRVGTCGALAPGLVLGELVVATEAIADDGTSRALGASERVAADPQLTGRLIERANGARSGTVVSVDLFYDDRGRDRHRDAVAVEMEAATLFAVGDATGTQVACVLTVSDTFSPDGSRRHIEDRQLLRSAERMGAAAIGALEA